MSKEVHVHNYICTCKCKLRYMYMYNQYTCTGDIFYMFACTCNCLLKYIGYMSKEVHVTLVCVNTHVHQSLLSYNVQYVYMKLRYIYNLNTGDTLYCNCLL